MKKIFLTLIVMMVAGILSACGEAAPTYELAVITDHGPIDDRSFNQGAWEGVKQYADENDISYTYYRPSEDSGAARLDAIRLAAESGAKVIVTPGFAFSEPIYEAQQEFPDIKFVLLDATPMKDDTEKIDDNVLSIFYSEEEAGFLVGYAAVKEGLYNLGYFGGVSVPAVIKFGVGYIEGAEYAAREEDVNVNMMYKYLGTFDAVPANKTLASSWYDAGTDVIFSAAGGAINNAISAAEELDNKWVIGCNVDQSELSERIITSSLKELQSSVYNAVKSYYDGDFDGGKAITLTAAEDGVGMPADFSKFENFTEADYNAIYEKIANGEIEITSDTSTDVLDNLDLQKTNLTVVE